jgi:hypothetical protein
MNRVLLFFILLLPATCFAQLDSAVSLSLISKFAGYSKKHPIEKVYLQFDKPYYAAGDTIYFKAYLTLGDAHLLSALSGVLYAELINNTTNKIAQTEKLEVVNGVAWGDFALSDTLTKSAYRVRAYTKLMRNEGESSFFEQNIAVAPVMTKAVYNAGQSTLILGSTAKADVQFFPEGGSLVTGVNSKIAFKAIGPDGLGTAITGEVIDNDNKKVCDFTSAHLGMGYFYLKPEIGKTYKAKITCINGEQVMADLPVAIDDGIGLSVSNDSANIATVNITANKACYNSNKGKDYTLSIYSGGKLVTLTCRLDSMLIPLYLHKRTLHSGITRLTLFSPEGEPLSERLLFIQNNDQLKLNISSDHSTYNKKEKVTIQLNANDKGDQPVSGDFSVSVIDEGKVPVDTNAENTILSNLLLTSELKGHIEQPGYYFNTPTPGTFANLDLLMLTQGYRGFEWKQVLNDRDTMPQYQPEKLLNLSGNIQTLNGKPVPNAEVGLGSIRQLLAIDTTADAAGKFSFNSLYITDTTTLLLKAGKGNKSWKAIINPVDEPIITPLPLTGNAIAASTIKPEIAAEMKKQYWQSGNLHKGIILKEVDIKENKNPEHLVPLLHSDNLNGAGRADQVVMGDDLVGCPVFIDCLRGKLRGVRFGSGGIYSARTPIELNGNTKTMEIIMDGVLIDESDPSLQPLQNINAADIYSIEVLENPAYLAVYGSKATGGALVITMRNGSERNSVNIQPGLTNIKFSGFYKARTFYSPKYEVKTPEYSLPDNRSTIYWQPVLLTDKSGNASFNFYNADGENTTYRVVVEGMDAKGYIGRSVYYYTVR